VVEQLPDWRQRGRAILQKDVLAQIGTAPAVILIEPQLAENMGTAARAMGNSALVEMRLVRPRVSHLDERAIKAASGADEILHNAKVFDTTEDAVADLVHVYATTARRRDMMKRIITPRKAAVEMRAALAPASADSPIEPVGILFGRERTGLENDDVALAGTIIEVPLNPSFCSLNLAQAVLLVGYEWHSAVDLTPTEQPAERASPPANQAEMLGLYQHLEHELDECGFLRLPDKRPNMVRNLRSIFARAGLTRQEVSTLHGVITELRWGRRDDRPLRSARHASFAEQREAAQEALASEQTQQGDQSQGGDQSKEGSAS
jgi:tRNA/rRNA methyltransferase